MSLKLQTRTKWPLNLKQIFTLQCFFREKWTKSQPNQIFLLT